MLEFKKRKAKKIANNNALKIFKNTKDLCFIYI